MSKNYYDILRSLRYYYADDSSSNLSTHNYKIPAMVDYGYSKKEDEKMKNSSISGIKKVIFNGPATIVLWDDGSKTIVKCLEGDLYSKEAGIALCVMKKLYGNDGSFRKEIKKWIPEDWKTFDWEQYYNVTTCLL